MMKQWQHCGWHGKPGSCFDNHCDIGHQVQLTSSDYGAGESCAPRLERTRVFCCDPAKGKSPFLPVPLDYLFPNPPAGKDVDTDFDLTIDDTWGTGHDETNDENNPDDAAFGFWVMTSPEEIQISLDKRDGSHWELFNCHDSVSEEAQTVQMVCMDISENSNCYKIGLGHGVPGTILEMPKGKGCGPAKYAVAVSMEVSKNQTMPHHINKRMAGALPVVYDLTFDYDWMRVPRDLGETQVRIDYSNEEVYWDNVVDKAGEKKQKRSLDEMGGNHKRWLEEEWRDDLHFGGLTIEELHKRWFGSDIVSWLKGLLNVNIKPTFTHDYDDSVTAIILNDGWVCKPNAQTTFSASISAKATARIQVSTSFGMTIMTKLGPSLDLSNSYLFLKTKGDVSAIFTIDALVKASYDSGDIALATLPFPVASFSVPKLLAVGPKFVLYAQASGEVEFAGHFETKVDISSWDIRQTYPDTNGDFDPKSLSAPQRDFNIAGLEKPTFNLSVTAQGHMAVYLKPTLSFGIEFDQRWKIGKCAAELVASGYVRLRAEGRNSEICPFKYGVDAGAILTARATAPDAFHWNPKSFDLISTERNLIPGDGSGTVCAGKSSSPKREIEDGNFSPYLSIESSYARDIISGASQKRGATYGPFFHILPLAELCPTIDGGNSLECNDIHGYDEDQLNDPQFNGQLKRDVSDISDVTEPLSRDITSLFVDENGDYFNVSILGGHHSIEKRGGSNFYDICVGDAKMKYLTPAYPQGSTIYDCNNWTDCNNFGFGIQSKEANGHNYIAEHILEAFNAKSKIQNEDKLEEWLKTETGASRLVKSVKNVILTTKYMANADIQTIYNDQGRRVAEKFREVEAALQRNWANSGTPYIVQNLDALWLKFMEEYTGEVMHKFKEYLTKWSGELSMSAWLQEQDNGQLTDSRQNLATKIASLQNEVNTITAGSLFPNPF
ncbi:hypothetical protein ABKA04_010209 [Annulohypoxylon sp. FPYF3050]